MTDHHPYVASSTIVRQVQRTRRRLQKAIGDSPVTAKYDAATRKLANATSRSGLVSSIERARRWTVQTSLHRWLTSEPDPDVIVVDLRESWTFGPVIAALDRLGRPLAAAWDDATVAGLAHGIEDVRLRTIGVVATAAIPTSLVFTTALTGLSQATVGWHLIVLGLALLVTRGRHSLGEVSETRFGRALIAVFEPPEPPADRDGPQQ